MATGGYAGSSLDRLFSHRLGNRRYNRLLWTLYPSMRRVANRVPATDVLGDEWGSAVEVEEIVREFILPYVDRDSVVCELGVGGGRIARHVAPRVRELHAIDISRPMLRRARKALRKQRNVKFIHLTRPECPHPLRHTIDFVYAFDVFVHFDLHELWRYTELLHELLVPGGRAMVHVASLTAPDGWRAFASQESGSIGGLCFVTPDVVRTFAERAGFGVVDESTPRPDNGYLQRDHIAVLQK